MRSQGWNAELLLLSFFSVTPAGWRKKAICFSFLFKLHSYLLSPNAFLFSLSSIFVQCVVLMAGFPTFCKSCCILLGFLMEALM